MISTWASARISLPLAMIAVAVAGTAQRSAPARPGDLSWRGGPAISASITTADRDETASATAPPCLCDAATAECEATAAASTSAMLSVVRKLRGASPARVRDRRRDADKQCGRTEEQSADHQAERWQRQPHAGDGRGPGEEGGRRQAQVGPAPRPGSRSGSGRSVFACCLWPGRGVRKEACHQQRPQAARCARHNAPDACGSDFRVGAHTGRRSCRSLRRYSGAIPDSRIDEALPRTGPSHLRTPALGAAAFPASWVQHRPRRRVPQLC